MTPKAKSDPENDVDIEDEPEDDAEKVEKPDGKGGKGSGKSAADSGGLESHIREVVTEAIDALLGDRTPAKSSPAQDERSVLKMVKDAQEELRKEEAKDSRFKEVADTVESLKKVVERPPARDGFAGKIQRWMWGSDE